MILCPVCGKGNGDLAVTCFSCRGYLQSKVDALDLFATAWAVIESPTKAFRKIALATHKNYTLLLASLFGIAWTYSAFWISNAAALVPNLFVLMVTGILVGPLLGIFCLLGVVTVALWSGRRIGGQANFRNLLALTAYSMIPLILSLIFILPVDIAVFGLAFFGSPPTPRELKPMIYGVLLALHSGMFAWTLCLMVLSASVAHGVSHWKGTGLALLIALILCAVIFIPHLLRG